VTGATSSSWTQFRQSGLISIRLPEARTADEPASGIDAGAMARWTLAGGGVACYGFSFFDGGAGDSAGF
jgi:hypothetical protein